MINDRLALFIDTLDNSNIIKEIDDANLIFKTNKEIQDKIKEFNIKKEIVNDYELMNLKKTLYSDEVISKYLKAESELFYVILYLNKRLKELHSEKKCI